MIKMDISYPKFTIITVSYNAVKTIEKTILSVINQKYDHVEYIIIDGASTDGTVDIIRKYENAITYWVSEPDKGIYDAMNKGILKATGEYIGIVNSDDWYEKNIFQDVNRFFQQTGADVIVGKMNLTNYDEKFIRVCHNKNIAENISSCMPVNHPAMFVRGNAYCKIGLFDVAYKLSADYDFVYRAFLGKMKIVFCENIFTNMRLGGATGGMGGVAGLDNAFLVEKENYLLKKKNTGKKHIINYGINVMILYLRKIKRVFLDSKFDKEN